MWTGEKYIPPSVFLTLNPCSNVDLSNSAIRFSFAFLYLSSIVFFSFSYTSPLKSFASLLSKLDIKRFISCLNSFPWPASSSTAIGELGSSKL